MGIPAEYPPAPAGVCAEQSTQRRVPDETAQDAGAHLSRLNYIHRGTSQEGGNVAG
jgi:hypothetical protein